MSSRIEQLIDEIEEYIEGCKPKFMSSTEIIVNKDEIDELLRELRMKTPDEQRVLRLRYLWGLNWKEIGEKMGYNERQPQRIHGRALNNFKMS